jgi:hypothetical protein
MKHKCLYCKNDLLKGIDNWYCIKCPIKVEYYDTRNDNLYVAEMWDKSNSHLIVIYFSNYDDTPIDDDPVLYISLFVKTEKYFKLSFDNDFGITPNNLEQKLQTILTFQ